MTCSPPGPTVAAIQVRGRLSDEEAAAAVDAYNAAVAQLSAARAAMDPESYPEEL
jgi:hypothetical protein